MEREMALKQKIVELAKHFEREDPKAAGVLFALASTMYANCTNELFELSRRFAEQMVARLSTKGMVARQS